MIMFGSMYCIVPRLVGREWRYASMIKLHFWAAAYGIGLMTLMLFAGGISQGAGMSDPTIAFSESTENLMPYLRASSLAVVLMTGGAFRLRVSFWIDASRALAALRACRLFLIRVESEGDEEHL